VQPLDLVVAVLDAAELSDSDRTNALERCRAAFAKRARKKKDVEAPGQDDGEGSDDDDQAIQQQQAEGDVPDAPAMLHQVAQHEALFLRGLIPAGGALMEEETDDGILRVADALEQSGVSQARATIYD
jgi:hypothetical protein